jgi:beta-N-acetylhexosaminidase
MPGQASVLCLLSFGVGIANANTIQIHQKPIVFNKERIALTRLYRKEHYGIDSPSITITPQMIVLHWTALDTLDKSFNFLNPAKLSAKERPELIGAGTLNVSAHYLVDRNGVIYQLMPDHWMARHVIGLNNSAIGIENVGGTPQHPRLTPKQVAADSALIRMLKKKYPTIQYLIGHYEYQQFSHSPLWLEKQPGYLTNKDDPGKPFMQAVRAKVGDLKLKYHPE